MKKIKGIHVRVGEKLEVIEFDNKYEEYRRLVGGDVIAGNFEIVGDDGFNFESTENMEEFL